MAEPTTRSAPARDCVLCPPLRFRVNAMAGLPGASSVLAHDAAFLLIPDVAPLAEGHLLLVTRHHHQCAGAFGTSLWGRALRWRDHVSGLYDAAYGSGDLLLFEHGPATSQGGGACVDHAHWHLLPGTPGVRAVLEERGLPGAPAEHAVLRAHFRTGRSYLLVEEEGRATVHAGDGVPSQFLRWAVAAATAPATPMTATGTGSGGPWRWQETFGLPGSRRRFLRTVRVMRRAAAVRAARR